MWIGAAVPRGVLSPAWHMLLAGDASPTRLFASLSGVATTVRVVDEAILGSGVAPSEVVAQLPGATDLVRRRVWLANAAGATYGYAVSWWEARRYAAVMASAASAPIGAKLASAKMEVFRDMVSVAAGTSAPLAAAFHVPPDTELWARTYVMWHGGAPLALICEVFSPDLASLLGTPPRAAVPPT